MANVLLSGRRENLSCEAVVRLTKKMLDDVHSHFAVTYIILIEQLSLFKWHVAFAGFFLFLFFICSA
jgi:hypothetical protein